MLASAQMFAGETTLTLQSRVRWFAAVLLTYVAVVLATAPEFIGDTWYYVGDIAGRSMPLWDFGHLIWRPLGLAVYNSIGAQVAHIRGTDAFGAVAWILTAINWVLGLVAVLCLFELLLRVAKPIAALFVCAAFLCTNAMVNYIQSGSSYVPGIALLLVSLWLVEQAYDRPNLTVWFVAAGVAFALAVAFWFPYVLSFPAVCVFAFNRRQKRWNLKPDAGVLRALLVFGATFGLVLAVLYVVGLRASRVDSIAGLQAWAKSGSTDWAQTQNWKRVVTGLPRSFIDLGKYPVLLKRYVMKDPYTRVTISDLFSVGLIRIGAFYLFVLALIVSLRSRPESRRLLYSLSTAAVTVLLFAVVLFESGSTERYLPAYPFVFLGAGAVINSFSNRPLMAVIAGFLLLMIGTNVCAFRRAGDAQDAAFRGRKEILDNTVARHARVAILASDEIGVFPIQHPLDDSSRLKEFSILYIVRPGTTQVERWKEQFAGASLQAWRSGSEMWISKRMLADEPRQEWQWIEGDSPVHWRELPAFLKILDMDRAIGGDDGFVRIANSAANQARLEEVKRQER